MNDVIINQNERLSNYDILRILCAVMVVVEHFCETGMFGAFGLVEKNTSSYAFLNFVYAFSRESVDVFILLSGYFLISSKNQRIGKGINLFLMTIFYSQLIYAFRCMLNIDSFCLKTFVIRFLPQNYFLFLYVTLYFLSPYLNRIVDAFSLKKYLSFLVLFVSLFAIWPTLINLITSLLNINLKGVYTLGLSGSDMGFNILTFILLYYIGGFIRKYVVARRCMTLVLYLVVGVILWATALFVPTVSKVFYYYDSFILIFHASLLVVLFKSIRTAPSKWIGFLAEKTYGVFLVHGFFLLLINIFFNIKEKLTVFSTSQTVLCTFVVIALTYIFSITLVSAVQCVFFPLSKVWKKSSFYNKKIFDSNL